MKKSNKPNYTFTIPHEIMQLVDIGKCDNLNIDVSNETIVVTKNHKTAKDIVKTIRLLNEISANLVVQLASACGECEDCYNCYYCEDFGDEDFKDVPDEVINTFLDAEICLGALIDFINNDEIIMEANDEE